jgi:UPF0755 protein
VVGGLFAWSFVPGEVVGKKGEIVEVVVESSSKTEVVQALSEHDLIASPMLLEAYATLLTPGARFKARTHLIERGASARQLVQRLAEVGSRPRVKITVVEGWTHDKIARRLHEKGVCSARAFIDRVFDRKLLDELAISAPSAEGLLFPATYQLSENARADEVLRRLVRESRARMAKLVSEHPPHPDLTKLRFGEWEILTLASIVERETATTQESPRVARVFLNRLLDPNGGTNGRLQSDPTAAYGCLLEPALVSCLRDGDAVTPEMLADATNRYNTYRYPGLPPGPIANPGEQAIVAVLSPAEGKDLYFVANGKGGHTFSESYPEHLEAVKKLRQMRGK